MIQITINDHSEDFETVVDAIAYLESTEPDDTPEGSVVTPLPPNKIHSATGIVTPKLPYQVDRDLASRLQEQSEEPLPNEPSQVLPSE